MTLNSKQQRELKARSHHLKPVVRLGQKGITENLLLETASALEAHELIKLHIACDDRDERQALCREIASRTGAEVVNMIGKVCVLYRKRAAPEAGK